MLYDDVAFLPEWPGVPVADEEGRIIAEALGAKRSILLAHHGILTTGRDIVEATYLAVAMAALLLAVGGKGEREPLLDQALALIVEVTGASTAYHLTRRGVRNVVLVIAVCDVAHKTSASNDPTACTGRCPTPHWPTPTRRSRPPSPTSPPSPPSPPESSGSPPSFTGDDHDRRHSQLP